MYTKLTRLGLFSIPHTSAPSLLLTQQTSRSKRYQEPRIPAPHAESAGCRALSGFTPNNSHCRRKESLQLFRIIVREAWDCFSNLAKAPLKEIAFQRDLPNGF